MVLASAFLAAAAQGRQQGVDAAAAFERLKAIEGAWEAPAANGQKATTTFELVGAGTVLLERYSNPALPAGGQPARSERRAHAACDVPRRRPRPVHDGMGVLQGRAEGLR